ncbi:hypothetical protein AYO47_09335 [Planctomyces sp. SCGC AG-212-M04]|nr:hypothetical protein AYO47_09335 [Planctomyces sp. SCGC AG-212-M04]
MDEDDEIVVHSTYQSQNDAVFPPSENAGLQLSPRDFPLSGESSRLRELAPFNFRDSPTPSSAVTGHNGADANRKLFTTDSWDRNEFAMFAHQRTWEFNTWVAGDAFRRFPPKFGSIGNNFLLSAPFVSQGTADPFRYELRRLLATSLGGYDYDPTNNPNGAPNYEEARERSQTPLNLNGILTGFDSKGNPQYRDLVPHPTFTIADGALTLPATLPAFSSINYTTLAGRVNAEAWARYDRQNMARDIFTMLWVLSGGKDGQDYTSAVAAVAADENAGTPGREDDHYDVNNGNVQTQIEGRDRVREMAQFAVNVVDALDRDNVITEFRYDENLINGWDISTTYQVVYGVEAAQLTLSEALAIRTPPTMSSNYIEYEDANHSRYHLFVELRNASPFPVSIQNEEWRIRRVRNGAIGGLADRYATLRDATFTSTGGTAGHVGPGDLYLIGSQDGGNRFNATDYRTSDFRVDQLLDGGYEAIVPNSNDLTSATNPSPPTNASTFTDYSRPLCDLDLFVNGPTTTHVGRYWANSFTNGGPAPTAQFAEDTSLLNYHDVDRENGGDGTGSVDETTNKITLVLERRRVPGAREINDASDINGVGGNPWIEVDRMPVTVQTFNVASTPIDTQLRTLRSTERREPFYPRTNLYSDPSGSATNVRQHTLPQLVYGASSADERNSSMAAGAANSYWQPHFDRNFASVMDLLSIPLYGYYLASTQPLGVYDQRLDRTSTGVDDTQPGEARMFRVGGPTKNLVDVNGRMSGHRTAAMRFLHPEANSPTNIRNLAARSTGYDGSAPVQIEVQKHYRNRWYRLLEFVTVPDRAEEQARQKVAFDGRVPGKLNLNMIRNEQVMAGLVDDPVHLNPANYPTTRLTQDALAPGGAPRNWFLEMQALRDQADPILGFTLAQTATNGIAIPGNLFSVPFRPLGHLDLTGDLSVTETILRDRVPAADTDMDNIPDTQGHGLFEARTQADVGSDAVDFHTRNRLLAKIQNRTTTRSNVFFVWATIGFFDAHQPPNGYVTIGAQAEDLPMRRAFAVVDMTRLEEAYEDANPADGTPGTFDFRKFIIYRKVIK